MLAEGSLTDAPHVDKSVYLPLYDFSRNINTFHAVQANKTWTDDEDRDPFQC